MIHLHQVFAAGMPTLERELLQARTEQDLRDIGGRHRIRAIVTGPGEGDASVLGWLSTATLHADWLRGGRKVLRLDHAAIDALLSVPPADAPLAPLTNTVIVEWDPHPRLVTHKADGGGPYLGVYLAHAINDAVEGSKLPATRIGGAMWGAMSDGPNGEPAVTLSGNIYFVTHPLDPNGGSPEPVHLLLWNLHAAMLDRRISHVVEFPRGSVARRKGQKNRLHLRRLVLTPDYRGVWETHKIGPPASASVETGRTVTEHLCHAHTARRWTRAAPADTIERDADGFCVTRKARGDGLLYLARVSVKEHVRGKGRGAPAVVRVTT